MHVNYYFLKKLAQELTEVIVSKKITCIFSQEKDELIIGFGGFSDEVFLKIMVSPVFSGIQVVPNFERAKRNSVDLMSELIHKQVLSISCLENERSLVVEIEEAHSVLIKFHGNRPNIIHFQANEPIYVFNSHLKTDFSIRIEELPKKIEQTHVAFEDLKGEYKKLFPTFGKEGQIYLEEVKHFSELTKMDEKWMVVDELRNQLENTPLFYVTRLSTGMVHLTLMPFGEILQTCKSAIEATNAFISLYQRTFTLDKEKNEWIRKLEREIKQASQYIEQSYLRLETLHDATSLEEIGHILMANLHQIETGITEVELIDFYRDKNIKIKLKKELSPQKNAENYYRKAKNERVEIEKIEENIAYKERFLEQLKVRLAVIQDIETVRELRAFVKKEGMVQAANLKPEVAELFKKYHFEGFDILVGKNAKNNDLLIQKYSFREDLWLHARDAQGSHVLIKHQAGKKIPVSVIEKAASIAAYYSKLRTEKLASVIYTPKKYVRKVKGLPDGAVILDKEQVILVEPHPN